MENSKIECVHKDDIHGHQWVTYSNPRNGKIRVSACQNCGTMLAGVLASRACKPIDGKHSIANRGWLIDKASDQSNTKLHHPMG